MPANVSLLHFFCYALVNPSTTSDIKTSVSAVTVMKLSNLHFKK